MNDIENFPPLDHEIEVAFRALPPDSPFFAIVGAGPDDIARLRELARVARSSDDALRQGGVTEFEELHVPGAVGGPEIELLVLRPTKGTGPFPCIYFLHGSGMVVSESSRDGMYEALGWVEEFGAVVVGVKYRVAPENPHPAPVEDCYAGLVWVAEHSDQLSIDPRRILIAGQSGGGGLAAGTALLSRDRHGPALTHQVLICPMLDDREQTVSSKFTGVLWDQASNRTGWTALLGGAREDSDVSPSAAPSRSRDFSNLPSAYLDAGSSEVFRDEVIEYASRLAQAGTAVELHIWSGAMHASELLAPQAEVSKAARAARTSFLRRALAPR